jgi:hypothetical protein
MDTLPILVPVVAGIVLCPTVILCTCLRQLQRRVDALEETSRVTAAVQLPPSPTGFLGGVTYGGTAAGATTLPLPTAPLASAGAAAYPYFTQMPPPPPPQLQPLPYALQQRRVV